MKVSAQWVREWVPARLDPRGMAERLTMAGLEVGSVEPVEAVDDKVVVGRILAVDRHPHADRLKVCRVNTGRGKAVQIVCGAENARAGIKVPVALPGARLAGGLVIKASEIRGVRSGGMLCSAAELGLGDSGAGLLVLDDKARPGVALHDHLRLDDYVFDIDLTPNRGDCLSVLGIARELAVLTNTRMRRPRIPTVAARNRSRIDITLKAQKDCPHYVGRVIAGINPDAVTPVWIQERLRRSGIRAIHPVVDITNYVMLELGQPMHAFDLDRLEGGIIVRHAGKNESLVTLDGGTVRIPAGTLLIADKKRPLALAGIMGGKDSGVDAGTCNLFLESAWFRPATIGHCARTLGLQTDSSYRFERGVDPELQRHAIQRATALLLEVVGGSPGPLCARSVRRHLPRRKPVNLRPVRVSRVLGHAVPPRSMQKILTRLGMKLIKSGNGWRVTPPSYRFDIAREVDLIEEVARVHGYDKIPSAVPEAPMVMRQVSEGKLDAARLKQLLVDRGYQEVITYSFIDPKVQKMLDPDHDPVRLANPIAGDMAVMRTSLWPGLLQAMLYNQNRQQTRLRLFEMGRRFTVRGRRWMEEEVLAGAACGPAYPEQWGVDERSVDFFDIKGDVEALIALRGRSREYTCDAVRHPALHPNQAARINIGRRAAGHIGVLHPRIRESLDLKQEVVLFELPVSVMIQAKIPVFKEISKYPAIRRDLAVVVDERLPARELVDCIAKVAGKLLVRLQLFDQYVGKGIDYGRKSLALGLTLQDSSRTLKEEEVEALLGEIVSTLTSELGAELRK